MNRIDRLFGILTMLQTKKYVSAEKISCQFNISIRTVYRDIKALCEQGIPISFEQYKGYFVVQGFFLPPVSFTTEEANALLLMETVMYGFADRSIQTHYGTALNKVKAVLRNTDKDKLEKLSEQTRLQKPSCMRYDFDYLSTIQNAIANQQILEVHYTNKNGDANRRKVEAIGLVFYALSWHMIGWCYLRNEYRDFKVERIQKLHNTGEPFLQNEHMPLADYMKLLPVNY